MKTKNTLFLPLLRTIFMILLIYIPALSSADTTLEFSNKHTNYTNFELNYFIEPDGKYYDIQEIQKEDFSKSINNHVSLGYESNEIWFRFHLKNSSNKPQEIVLELTEVFFDTVELYRFSSGRLLSYEENGLNVPVQKRQIKEPTPSFAFKIAPNETQTLYLKIKTIDHGVATAILLKQKETFLKDIQTKKYLYFAYFIMLATIILYNLIYYIYFRDSIYFHYVAYIILFSLWVANYKGLVMTFSDTSLYHWIQSIIPLFFISFLYFSQALLESKKAYPKLHSLINGIIGISFVIAIYMLFSKEFGLYLLNILSIPVLIVLLLASIWLLKKTRFNILYLLALTLFVGGMILFGLMTLGYLSYSYWMSNLILLLSIIEIGLFSLLFVYRINLIRQESLESREKLLEQQKTESTRLFHAVAEKTKELNRAKKELEEELRKKEKLQKHLQHLASTDPMTELYNRRAFFDICDLEVSGAKMEKESLACLVLDIDHFKTINDTYGHDAGDAVITAVAKLMITNTRDRDHIGRIGGEEFAVLMPKTNAEAAYQIADRLRENIARHSIAIANHDAIKVTVSIGLSSLNKHTKDESIHTILKRADTALYEAKRNGRNQVCCLPKECEAKQS